MFQLKYWKVGLIDLKSYIIEVTYNNDQDQAKIIVTPLDLKLPSSNLVIENFQRKRIMENLFNSYEKLIESLEINEGKLSLKNQREGFLFSPLKKKQSI